MTTNVKRKLLYIYLPCLCGSPFDFYNIKSFEYISRLLGLGVRVECADYSVVEKILLKSLLMTLGLFLLLAAKHC